MPTFEVRCYQVVGNTVLTKSALERALTNSLGAAVTIEEIRQGLGRLQVAYRERGYVTVAVSLPQQRITNGTVVIRVTEGRLAAITVTGNQHFSSNNVMRALPSARENALLNSFVFQRELDEANASRDRQIYPTIGPGPQPGTSALTLKVKDRLPFHGRLELDNYATPDSPDLRINAAAQYNNLWQREHQLGLSYGFTPQAMKGSGLGIPDYLFNRPLISYYGGYYRMRFGEATPVELRTNSSWGQFGYNEATHEFRLPPAGLHPEATVYASGSSSDTGVKYAERKLVTQTSILSIFSQDSGQNATINEDLGGRLSLPYSIADNTRLSFFGGLDLKRYSLASFNTNSFIFSILATNSQGPTNIVSETSSPQPPMRDNFNYLPVNAGTDFSVNDRWGTTAGNITGNFNLVGEATGFASAASQAKVNYIKGDFSLSRTQRIYNDWNLLARAGGQLANGPLISNEQFALGGQETVRGYYEGDEYGDSGWFGSLEVRSPFWEARMASINTFVPIWIRGSVFMDYGQRYYVEPAASASLGNSLWGTGAGLSANINNHFDVRLCLAWPLLASPNTQAGQPRFTFSIAGQF